MSRLPSGPHGAGGNRGGFGTGLGSKDAVHPVVLVMEGMVAEPLQNRPTPTLENPSRGNPGVDHPAIRKPVPQVHRFVPQGRFLEGLQGYGKARSFGAESGKRASASHELRGEGPIGYLLHALQEIQAMLGVGGGPVMVASGKTQVVDQGLQGMGWPLENLSSREQGAEDRVGWNRNSQPRAFTS